MEEQAFAVSLAVGFATLALFSTQAGRKGSDRQRRSVGAYDLMMPKCS